MFRGPYARPKYDGSGYCVNAEFVDWGPFDPPSLPPSPEALAAMAETREYWRERLEKWDGSEIPFDVPAEVTV